MHFYMTQGQTKKLYVGSLPYSVTEDELRELFSPFGTVESARIIADKFTGQSKGFGFVEMSTHDEALRAIEELNGKPLNGRTLLVNLARPQEPRTNSRGGDRPSSFRGDRPPRGERGERSFAQRRY